MQSCSASISGASFRDPAGYVFSENGTIKRLVTAHGAAEYNRLMSSGLYKELTDRNLLIPHREEKPAPDSDTAAILVPERIPYISYPYEWSFGQFRDAALLTLEVQEAAMRRGMSLKDASAFNVQFRGAQPVFIDTLSFEDTDARPWVAYSQFCRHFVGPLLMMSYVSPLQPLLESLAGRLSAGSRVSTAAEEHMAAFRRVDPPPPARTDSEEIRGDGQAGPNDRAGTQRLRPEACGRAIAEELCGRSAAAQRRDRVGELLLAKALALFQHGRNVEEGSRGAGARPAETEDGI